MNNRHTSSILLFVLLLQGLSGGGSLFACLHRDHHTVHLSHVHTACPSSGETEAHGRADRDNPHSERDEAGCVDIMLELLSTIPHTGISLGDAFRKVLALVPSGPFVPAISCRQPRLLQRLVVVSRQASPQCRIGTVMLTC